ncbi:ArsR/SmtB family transcription factor [Demequina oxidasica]|uniref:ArsR/SmtB family transcription factor n=1 Tax=Demequina oxidasica TaxID=676199 RepID=UPI000A06AE4C|nr:metalloregulator ArsR/SmtB family transcription factor [Demequina oxidasica]
MSTPTRQAIPVTDVTAVPASGAGIAADACAPAQGVAPLSPVAAANAAGLLKAVADPLRLRMLSYLSQSGQAEACVCDLAELADVSQPTVSHHLKVLREAGILTSERRGTWVWYSLAPAHAPAVDALLGAISAPQSTPLITGENR